MPSDLMPIDINDGDLSDDALAALASLLIDVDEQETQTTAHATAPCDGD